MSFHRKKKTHTMTGATGSFNMHLGAQYVRVHKVEIKGDDADVDSNTEFTITDADGRLVMASKAVDAGTDDSSVLATSQDYSTVGKGYYLCPNEADKIGVDAAAITDNQGSGSGVLARSPVTVAIAAGTSGDAFEVSLLVEH